MKIRNFKIGCLVLLMSIGGWGCYSFTGTTLPPHLKTIRIHPVDDLTLNPDLSEKLSQSLNDLFRTRSSLRIVNDKGHCDLKVKLKSYVHKALSTSGSDVVDFQINMEVEVSFYDNVKNKMIYKEERMPVYASYSVSNGETELFGQAEAINKLVSLILDNTISGW